MKQRLKVYSAIMVALVVACVTVMPVAAHAETEAALAQTESGTQADADVSLVGAYRCGGTGQPKCCQGFFTDFDPNRSGANCRPGNLCIGGRANPDCLALMQKACSKNRTVDGKRCTYIDVHARNSSGQDVRATGLHCDAVTTPGWMDILCSRMK